MQVKALRDCFVGTYRRAGEEFEFEGPKNTNLQPLGGAKWPAAKPPTPKPVAVPANAEAAASEPEPAK